MRTTLELDDQLVRMAKKRAVEEGKTLTALIQEALRHHLSPPPVTRRRFRLRLLTRKGRLVPGVNIADRDRLYEIMEGRR
jgi:putative antitoxin of VapBC-like toxin-antitoxin system